MFTQLPYGADLRGEFRNIVKPELSKNLIEAPQLGYVGRSVFEQFVSNKPEHLGLGLAIAKAVIKSHGGDVELAPRGGVAGGASLELRWPRDLNGNIP